MSIQNHWNTWIRSQLTHWDIPSQEMFDIQTRVLERTQQKLRQLEMRIQELESQLAASHPGGDTDDI